jgi:hypothetical protein
MKFTPKDEVKLSILVETLLVNRALTPDVSGLNMHLQPAFLMLSVHI